MVGFDRYIGVFRLVLRVIFSGYVVLCFQVVLRLYCRFSGFVLGDRFQVRGIVGLCLGQVQGQVLWIGLMFQSMLQGQVLGLGFRGRFEVFGLSCMVRLQGSVRGFRVGVGVRFQGQFVGSYLRCQGQVLEQCLGLCCRVRLYGSCKGICQGQV